MLRSLMTVSGLTLLSRLLGFVRDMITFHYLGATGKAADSWITAYMFPNMFRRVFGEGAFNSAFVPLYGKKIGNPDGEADRYASNVIILMGLILAVILVISLIFMKPIMFVFSGGFPPDKLALCVTLGRITASYMVFICLVAAFSGMLNSHKVFGAPAISYAMLNVIFIPALLIFADRFAAPEYVLAYSTIVIGIVQLLIVVIAAKRKGLRFHFRRPRIDSEVKKLGLLMAPGLIAAGVQQLNLLVGTGVASFQDGGKTFIYAADRIHQFPLGLIGMSFTVVLIPELTRFLKAGNEAEAKKTLANGLELAAFLAIPAMVGMAVIAEPILYAIFKSGKFTAHDAQMAGNALIAFSFGVPAYVLSKVLQPGFFAREDTKTPMKFTLISAGVNIILCLVAYFTLKGTQNLHVGCAAATSVAGWVNLLLLWVCLKRRGLLTIPLETFKKIGLMVLAAVIMGLAVWQAAEFLNPFIHSDMNRIFRIGLIALVGSFGITAYFLAAHLTGAINFRTLKARFKR